MVELVVGLLVVEGSVEHDLCHFLDEHVLCNYLHLCSLDGSLGHRLEKASRPDKGVNISKELIN